MRGVQPVRRASSFTSTRPPPRLDPDTSVHLQRRVHPTTTEGAHTEGAHHDHRHPRPRLDRSRRAAAALRRGRRRHGRAPVDPLPSRLHHHRRAHGGVRPAPGRPRRPGGPSGPVRARHGRTARGAEGPAGQRRLRERAAERPRRRAGPGGAAPGRSAHQGHRRAHPAGGHAARSNRSCGSHPITAPRPSSRTGSLRTPSRTRAPMRSSPAATRTPHSSWGAFGGMSSMALIDVAQEHPDPDLDLSSALQVFMVGAAAEALPDQCLFGSNPPCDDPVASRATVEAAIADPGIRRQVMGLNAAAVLRLRSGARPRPRTRNRNAPHAARSRVDRRPDLSSSALHAVASSARMTRHPPARCDSRRTLPAGSASKRSRTWSATTIPRRLGHQRHGSPRGEPSRPSPLRTPRAHRRRARPRRTPHL